MLSIKEMNICHEFLKYLKTKHPIKSYTVHMELIDSNHIPGYEDHGATGLFYYDKKRRKAYIETTTNKPLITILATIGHEYCHGIQRIVEKRDIENETIDEREGEAYYFGGVEADAFLKESGYAVAPAVFQSNDTEEEFLSIAEMVKLRNAA